MVRKRFAFNHSSTSIFFLIACVLWTSVLAVLLLWNVQNTKHQTEHLARGQARSYFKQILATRHWNALHGGVYVPVTDSHQPNPFLKNDPTRDLVTRDGTELTKINPAYMTRQIAEIAKAEDQALFHITSTNPIRPQNIADPWEKSALLSFSPNMREKSGWIEYPDQTTVYRYMAPLWVKASCLSCHAEQGYEIGDLRGGISVTFPGTELLGARDTQITTLSLAYLIIWLLGLSGIIYGFRFLRREERERESLIQDLRKALTDVKKLSGLIPVCSSCKHIRTDKGYWEQIETYIMANSEARFSHGICPDCARELYPDIVSEDWFKEQ